MVIDEEEKFYKIDSKTLFSNSNPSYILHPLLGLYYNPFY